MKFREFVGEKKVRAVRKIVRTKIGPTEADFLKQVAKENPDGSKIISKPYYLEYGLSKKALKRIFDYIKSWFIRYNVPFESINPHLVLYLLDNLPKNKSMLINSIKSIKKGKIYKPKGTITVISPDEKNFPRTIMEPTDKDQIVLNYVPSKDYKFRLEYIFDGLNIEVLDKFCHVKLFEIESGMFTHRMYEDMMYSAPKFTDLRLGNIILKG